MFILKYFSFSVFLTIKVLFFENISFLFSVKEIISNPSVSL